MRCVSDLSKVSRSVRRRLARLRIVLVSCPRSDSYRRNATVTWAVIELDNLIINLQREFLVSSLMGCRTASGHRVSHRTPNKSQNEAAHFIIQTLEPNRYRNHFTPGISLSRREETVLRDPAKIMQVATAAGLTNTNSIVSALSLSTSIFRDLSKARHFFAHRNLQTAAKVDMLSNSRGLPTGIETWLVVDTLLPGYPYTLLDEWIYDLEQFHPLLTN